MQALSALVDAHVLSTLIFLPLGGVLLLWVLELALRAFANGARISETVWKLYALLVSALGFLLSLDLWSRFDPSADGLQLVERVPWIEKFGIYYYIGVDGISLFLVVLTAFLLPIILLASWKDIGSRIRQYIFFMLALQTGMLGAFLSVNLFLFYVFWEAMLVPMYFLIGIWGGPRRIYATVKFFIYTMVGSLLMLVGILTLVYMAALSPESGGRLTFDFIGSGGAKGILELAPAMLPDWPAGAPWYEQRQAWLFLAFAFAFAIKVPMFPFHTWLPDAHVEAPTPASAVLAGVLLKLGTYGFVRYAIPLFPQAAAACAPLIVILAVIGIVYGALVAMVQSDVKKLVAYSSVSHLGFVMLGLFAFNMQGIEGAILQMVNHGVSTGALFLLVGMIYERRHVREIEAFGGIARVMPVFTLFFLISVMSSIGLPLLNGFVGEFLILIGAFGTYPVMATLATIGVILSAVYMLWMVRRVFFGPVLHEVNQRLQDLSLRERLVAATLVVPMIWVGVYPASFLRPMDRSVENMVERLRPSDVLATERSALAPIEEPQDRAERTKAKRAAEPAIEEVASDPESVEPDTTQEENA